jgi:hypothetical protein
MTLPQQKRFETRARTAKLRRLASVEDIDYRAARGLAILGHYVLCAIVVFPRGAANGEGRIASSREKNFSK